MTSVDAQITALKNGDVDIILGLNTETAKQLEGAELVENYLDAEETGGAAGMESALDAAKEEGFSADEFLAAVNQERNRRGKEEKEAEAGEEINSEYWSGGTDIYNYDTLYQAVLNGDCLLYTS